MTQDGGKYGKRSRQESKPTKISPRNKALKQAEEIILENSNNLDMLGKKNQNHITIQNFI